MMTNTYTYFQKYTAKNIYKYIFIYQIKKKNNLNVLFEI